MRHSVRRDWRDEIKVGDILVCKSGERVVRLAHYRKNGILHSVGFAILRKSWTTRGYTIYARNDLKQMGYAPTGKRYTFIAGSIDVKLWRDMENKYDGAQFKIKAHEVISMGLK